MPELVRARSVTGRQGRCPRQPPRWLPRDPKFIADTDFASLDPVRLDYGQSISPEGNAHQAEFTRDNKYFIATDEDFDPYRVTATMGDGTSFTAIQGSDVPQIDQDTTLAGDTRCVGLACDTASIPPADAAHPVAVIERGVCDFTVKVQNVEAQGYKGAIVFNRTGVDGCETLISMLVEASIPAVFVSRTDGFRILPGGVPVGYTCSEDDGSGTAAPPAAADGQTVDIKAVFDGWGYVHQYDATTMQDVDQYALPEGQDPACAGGLGDLSVHEVATDPDRSLAYISYYAGGFRVVSYGPGGIRRSAASSTRAATTSGASRCTSTPTARSTCSPPTATAASTCSSTRADRPRDAQRGRRSPAPLGLCVAGRVLHPAAHVDGHDQVNTGARFSRKAPTPSA